MATVSKLLVVLLLLVFVGNLKAVGFDSYTPDQPYVVLIPGAGANGGKLYVKGLTELLHLTGHEDYFEHYYEILRERNIPFTLCPQTEDHDTRMLTTRAAECVGHIWNELRKSGQLPRKNIILLGHSMGGNIARLVSADPLLGTYIHSVLTISSSHQGSVLADFVFDQMDKGFTNRFYRSIIKLIGFMPTEKKYIKELEVARTRSQTQVYFAQDVPKNPLIKYYSISNSSDLNFSMPPLEVTRRILQKEMVKYNVHQTEWGLKNDGVIPTYSMIHGEHVAHVESDHFAGVCIGILRHTKGCENMRKALIPFIEKLNAEVQDSLD